MSFIQKALLCLAAVALSHSVDAVAAPSTTPTMPFSDLANSINTYAFIASSSKFAAAALVGSQATIVNNVVLNVTSIHTTGPLTVSVCGDKAGVPDNANCQPFSTGTNPIPASFTNVSYTGSFLANANARVWVVVTAGGSGVYAWGASTLVVSANSLYQCSGAGGAICTWGAPSNWQLSYSISGIPAAAPTATAVTITGTPQVGSTLTGSYTYTSTVGAAQGNTTMRWMSGSNAGGSDKVAISGATTSTYTPVAADGGNYFFYCVTPVAQTGILTGAETCSSGAQFVLVSNITSPTTVTGIGPNQVAPLDLSTGYGPTLTQCLMNTLQQLLGVDAVYLGQVSGGGTRVQQGGKVISFYVVRAGGDSSQGSGLQLLQSNAMTVGTSCGNLGVTPALYNPTEFGAALTAAGLSASINAQGVITVTGNGSVYVARPDYFVTPGQAAGPSLKPGADGQYRFTDSAGNSQVLRAAFLSPDALQASAGAALGGYLVIQIDGTALFTQFSGPQSVLSPDLVLGGIPAASATATWWTDGPNHYRFPVGLASQGLTQTAK